MAEDQGVNNSTWTIPMAQASESHPDLVEVSSRSAYLKRASSQSSKSDVHRWLLAGIILLAFITAVLLISVGILSYHFNKTSSTVSQPTVCTSKQCVETAASLIESLDFEADPCEDFYKFTCGKWAGNHPIPDFTSSTDWFNERKLHLAQRIRKVLEKKYDDAQPVPVRQAQMLYQSCLNTTGIDDAGIEPILQVLDHAGLPRNLRANATTVFNLSYSYPSMSEGNLTYTNPMKSKLSKELRWLVPLVGCKKVLGKDSLIGFEVYPHPLNKEVNVLTVAAPSLRSPLPENELTSSEVNRRHLRWHWQEHWTRRRNDNWWWEPPTRKGSKRGNQDDPKEKKDETATLRVSYMESMVKLLDLWEALKNVTIDPTVVVDFVTNFRPEVNSNGSKQDALKNYIYQIDALRESVYELFLKSIEEDINMMYEFSSGKNMPLPFEEMHVSDLQRLTDEAAYEENSNPNLRIDWQIFFNLMFEKSNVSLDLERDLIIVQNLNYLKDIAKLLSTTSPLVLEGLLWWEVMYVIAPHGNSLMRHLYISYVEKITGGEIPRSRANDCASVTNNMMGMAVSWLLASEELAIKSDDSLSEDEDFTNVIEDKKNKVRTMLTDIRIAFSDLVSNLDWMDEETKEATLTKAEAMRSYVGYPSWLMPPGELEAFYKGLTINVTTYLQNLVNKVQVWQLLMLEDLRIENNFEYWATDPTDVNAFHTFQENAITIPAGILQFPFYGLGLDVLNYGAIGSILGHELTHGFDNFGRHFDQNGNWRQWWSNRTISEYMNRTGCFVTQYSSYLMPEVNVTVNGKQTLGENIADNGGIHEALAAFERYKQRTNEVLDMRLPGLEQFSQDHLIFIAFGSLWCEHGTNTTVKWTVERDEHSPGRARVWGAVSNSEEFARAFNCPVGSPMNPEVKCRIW